MRKQTRTSTSTRQAWRTGWHFDDESSWRSSLKHLEEGSEWRIRFFGVGRWDNQPPVPFTALDKQRVSDLFNHQDKDFIFAICHIGQRIASKDYPFSWRSWTYCSRRGFLWGDEKDYLQDPNLSVYNLVLHMFLDDHSLYLNIPINNTNSEHPHSTWRWPLQLYGVPFHVKFHRVAVTGWYLILLVEADWETNQAEILVLWRHQLLERTIAPFLFKTMINLLVCCDLISWKMVMVSHGRFMESCQRMSTSISPPVTERSNSFTNDFWRSYKTLKFLYKLVSWFSGERSVLAGIWKERQAAELLPRVSSTQSIVL